MERTHVFINRRMDRQTVVYPFNGIQFSNIKELGADTCCSTDEPQKHHTK